MLNLDEKQRIETHFRKESRRIYDLIAGSDPVGFNVLNGDQISFRLSNGKSVGKFYLDHKEPEIIFNPINDMDLNEDSENRFRQVLSIIDKEIIE